MKDAERAIVLNSYADRLNEEADNIYEKVDRINQEDDIALGLIGFLTFGLVFILCLVLWLSS